MTQPFIGQIQPFGFNFAPLGWALCNGQLMSIQQNTALFALLGTSYGGNGTTTFALPDLRGRAPYAQGQGPGLPNYTIGQVFGATATTLTVGQMPTHTHQLTASSSTDTRNSPAGALFATFAAGVGVYTPAGAPADTPMAANAIGTAGGSQPVPTQSPALSMNWCVAMQGIFPSRN